ncbi:MAG: glycine--tRNA ligase subunit beta, partial [Psychrobium sp.]
TKNLVKGISDLKNVNYFEGLGTYFDKTQRLRKLGSLISDELLISKEKVEVASSICKVDLVSDLVGESVKAIVGRDITVSVEVVDMDTTCYFKR